MLLVSEPQLTLEIYWARHSPKGPSNLLYIWSYENTIPAKFELDIMKGECRQFAENLLLHGKAGLSVMLKHRSLKSIIC